MNNECSHNKIHPDTFDQTIGVSCPDCSLQAWCWSERHCSEALWNKACQNDSEGIPCKKNRNNYCFLCGEKMKRSSRGEL